MHCVTSLLFVWKEMKIESDIFVNQHLRLLIKRRRNAKWNFFCILFFCVNVNDNFFFRCTCASMNYRFRCCCRKKNKLKIAFECRDKTIAASEHILREKNVELVKRQRRWRRKKKWKMHFWCSGDINEFERDQESWRVSFSVAFDDISVDISAFSSVLSRSPTILVRFPHCQIILIAYEFFHCEFFYEQEQF